ncbi:hypothetical protein RhiJN_03686 [Ceratobasidium sp. AG-Ba]|nr:hypothetical protein RhiJN_03686 [Ceratobasidium sp. AG-Ba]
MVQIPTRARTLSFSVREAGHCSPYGRTRPLDPLARGEEPDAKRARQSYAPIPMRVARSSVPLAPQSVNVTVTAVPFPTNDDPAATEDAEPDSTWGTSSIPTVSSGSPRQKRLIARASSAPTPPPVSVRPAPPPPPPPAPTTTWTRRPSPLAPYWTPSAQCVPIRTRRGRNPPEPLARRALRAYFSRTPHGAAVVKLGARRAIAQAECVAAVERVRASSSGIVNARRNAVGNVDVLLAPPVVMVSPPSPTTGVSLPLTSTISDDEWVPLSVQPMEVEPDERDIVEMDTESDGWCRV